jgi:hypothetical protein
MSNDPASEASSPPSGPATQGMPPSRIVLYAILGLLIVALGYDFLVARPGQQAAAEKLNAFMPDQSGGAMISNAEPTSYEQVIEAIGVEPSSSMEGPTYFMDQFSWRSGLPWRSHDLYVIYTKRTTTKDGVTTTEPSLLHDISVGQEPESTQFPRPATAGVDARPVTGTAAAGADQTGAAQDRSEPPPRGSEGDRTEAAGDEGGSEEEPAKTTPQPEPAG